MKNFLIYFAVALFVIAMVLLADNHLWYGIVGILTAIMLVMSSCLIDKEEENLALTQQVAHHALRGNLLEQQAQELATELTRTQQMLESRMITIPRAPVRIRVIV